MQTRTYRTAESAYERATQPVVEVGGIVRLTLPEPPSLNAMIELRARFTRKWNGKFFKRRQNLYWLTQQDYQAQTAVLLDAAGHRRPAEPWQQWAIVRAEFRLWSLRDEVELCSSLKWPVDTLVKAGWVKNDSPAELKLLCLPEQKIHRERRGVDLWIRRDA
jgi:hypothetical protein